MSRFIETMQISDGRVVNLPYHNARMRMARRASLSDAVHIRLEDVLTIPEEYKTGKYVCRVVYGGDVESIEFKPHVTRNISSLKMVHSGIDYSHKYEDRSGIRSLFEQRGECDDILIMKDGLVTDTSISNVVLWDGTEWVTPEKPLLPGTKRAQLLADGYIRTGRIRIDNLRSFHTISLINALLELGELTLPVENIK